MRTTATRGVAARTFKQDEVLVQKCLKGSEEAWSALIDKYKNLIFSIPIKYGFSSDEATDIFQAVCLALLSELPMLREPRALAAWLIQTTRHKCFRWKNRHESQLENELSQATMAEKQSKRPDDEFRELEREQLLRDSVSELPAGCKRLVELLFFPPKPPSYDEIAIVLGVPKGSIGPTRLRCLGKLRQLLEDKGF